MNAIVTTPICPIMLQPSPLSQRSDEVLSGMCVELLESGDGWQKVKTAYGYEGYVQENNLLPGDEWAEDWTLTPKAVVLRALCDVLARPDIKSPILCSLVRGCLVATVGHATQQGWQEVRLSDGQVGYLKQGGLGCYFTRPPAVDEAGLRALIIRSACSYLGDAYRWGGKTPLGIDCSGLTSMAYLLNGVFLWRDAQIRDGYPVHSIPQKRIRPADLLYFPGHIALYLGQGRYLHATAKDGSDGVVCNSLDPNSPEYRADLSQSITAVGSIF